MPKPRPRRDEDEPIEADLIPVLSCMFMLIPALLLAMEVATMVAIHVAPPRFSDALVGRATTTEDLTVSVHIRSDGFATKIGGEDLGEILLRDGDYDYPTLEHWAAQLGATHPHVTRVTVSAENDVMLQTLVSTLDTLRGRDCELSPAMHGEAIDDDCLLWNPVVSASPLS